MEEYALMKKKTRKVEDILQEYDERFGDIPLETEEILSYLRDKYPKLNMDEINIMAEAIDQIPWNNETHIIPIIPKPAARPRYSFESSHFYVPGSSTNKGILKKILGVSNDLIATRTKVQLDFYIPTPCYKMTQREIYLAEMKKIHPLIDPDVDNLIKAYLDAVQGLLLADDNIVTSIVGNKFFSIKPRLYLSIDYQSKFDSTYNERLMMKRIMRSAKKGELT